MGRGFDHVLDITGLTCQPESVVVIFDSKKHLFLVVLMSLHVTTMRLLLLTMDLVSILTNVILVKKILLV